MWLKIWNSYSFLLFIFQTMEPKVIKEEAVDKDQSNYVENSPNCGGRTRASRGTFPSSFYCSHTQTFKLNIASFAQYFDGN